MYHILISMLVQALLTTDGKIYRGCNIENASLWIDELLLSEQQSLKLFQKKGTSSFQLLQL